MTSIHRDELSFGATNADELTHFRVWAPNTAKLVLRLLPPAQHAGDHAMTRAADGTFTLELRAKAGNRYFLIPEGQKSVPDPVSRLLPEGVHGPSEIVDPNAFVWTDEPWRGLALSDAIFYELHIGTFTPAGTFDAAIAKLDYLKRLGITAVEIMPVAAFPGTRNWGYDGVSPYAVQASYGGPDGLKRFVDAAHQRGLAVALDVVYNHLGNEGNYLNLFGPYFTAKHKTPWGDAVNYDDVGSEHVRRYFVENARYWAREYHIDGLRLDAVQTIRDDSPRHIVAEIADAVHALGRQLGRKVFVIAETDENDRKYLLPPAQAAAEGGYGLDAVWSDDFHHAIHTVLTGESKGYYQDFGRLQQIVRALNEGFVFQGEHCKFWNVPRGTSSAGVPPEAHVICIQNHDQVGNRALGERLTQLVPRGARKVAAALLLLAPQTPLLFMGQEYDEAAPFQFFTDYGDPHLQEAVRIGRREEFKDFAWEEVPDPQDPNTFARSKLAPNLAGAQEVDPRSMWNWYRKLLELRKQYVTPGERNSKAELRGECLWMEIPAKRGKVILVANLRPGLKLPLVAESKQRLAHTKEDCFECAIELVGESPRSVNR